MQIGAHFEAIIMDHGFTRSSPNDIGSAGLRPMPRAGGGHRVEVLNVREAAALRVEAEGAVELAEAELPGGRVEAAGAGRLPRVQEV